MFTVSFLFLNTLLKILFKMSRKKSLETIQRGIKYISYYVLPPHVSKTKIYIVWLKVWV